MLCKCDFNEKVHLCPSREDRNSFKTELMVEALINSIPEDPRLKDLFIRWSLLKPEQRKSINDQLVAQDPDSLSELYLPLMRALTRWENIQDSEGAPGFETGHYGFTCDSNLDEQLSSVVIRMEKAVDEMFENNEPHDVGEVTSRFQVLELLG